MVTAVSQRSPRRLSGRPPGADGAARREEILNTAAELFSTEGYRGMSMSRIARACGMSQTGLVHYFPTKDDLLRAVLGRRTAVHSARYLLPASERPRGWDCLAGLVETVRSNQAQPGMVGLFTTVAGEAVDPDHPAHSWLREHHNGIAEAIHIMLAEAAEDGQLADGAPIDSIARIIIAAMDGLQIQWLADPGYEDMAADIEVLIDSLRRRWKA